MRLADLKNGQVGIIIRVRGRGSFKKRIIDMGFIKGKPVRVIKNAPLRDPIEYKLMDYNVSLRRSEAQLIDVLTQETIQQKAAVPVAGSEARTVQKKRFRNRKRNFDSDGISATQPKTDAGDTSESRRGPGRAGPYGLFVKGFDCSRTLCWSS